MLEQYDAHKMCYPSHMNLAPMQQDNTCPCSDVPGNCALVMAYVMWQSWERTYEPAVALERGTIFPSLDLPFLGGGCCR